MFKHILIPLDGSMLAETALPAAAFLAGKLKTVVTLIHVIERNAPREVHGQPHLKNAEAAMAYLRNVSLRWFPEEVHVNCHVHAAEVNDVAKSIVSHRNELGHDIIVMCSHGRGRALHLLFGSIAQRVISMGSVPVLIIHPDEKKDNAAFSCRSMLVPLDEDPDHTQALSVSRILAGVCGASIHLVTVIPHFGTLSGQMAVKSRLLPGTTSHLLEISMEQAEEGLRAHLETLTGQGLEASAHVLRGDPATVISDAARQSQVDLIILATHGKSGMEAFWAGSVAHKVCSLCRIPILLIPIKKR